MVYQNTITYTVTNYIGFLALMVLILAVLYIMINLLKEIKRWRNRIGIKELREKRFSAFALTIWRAIFIVILLALFLSVIFGKFPLLKTVSDIAAVKSWLIVVLVVGIVPPVIAELLIPERLELWKRIIVVLLFLTLSFIVSLAVSTSIIHVSLG